MIKRTFMHIVKYRKSIRNLNNLHLRGLLFMPLGGGKSTRGAIYAQISVHVV
jgi:hypothetical protein